MNNQIYNYPQSSIDSYNCANKKHPYNYNLDGNPSNRSIPDDKLSDTFICNVELPFNEEIQPLNISNQKYKTLNKLDIRNKNSENFSPVNCNPNSCNKSGYFSQDPRLMSAPRAQYLILDSPPTTNEIKLKDINTDTTLDGYGQKYSTYSDIKAGQYVYHQDDSRTYPYHEPNFSTQALVTKTVYKDPMGSIKPQYYRESLNDENPLETEGKKYDGCLSWIQDSMEQRQDILASQQSIYDEKKWRARWY